MLRIISTLTEKLPNSPTRLYLAIFVFAFLIRLTYISMLDNKWYFYDTVHYDKAAQSIVSGNGFGSGYTFSERQEFQSDYSLPPIYPLFLASVYYFFGQDFFATRVVQSMIGAMICLMIFLIGKELFGKKTALLATIASLVYPMFIFISGLLYIETLFTFFICLTIWFLLRYLDASRISALLLSGLFLGLATLSRPILFALYPLLGLWLILVLQKPLVKRIAVAALLYGITFITLLPWTIRNYMVFGKITPVSAAFSWYLSNVEKRVETGLANPDEMTVDRENSNNGVQAQPDDPQPGNDGSNGGMFGKIYHIVTDDPVGFVKHYVGEFVHFWTLYPDRVETDNRLTSWLAKMVGVLSFGPILLFSILGIYYSVADWRKPSLLVLTILSFALGYAFFLTRVRYRIPIEPYMIILAAYGLLTLLEKLRGTENQETY